MKGSEGKYFETARRIDKAFLDILEKRDFEYITVKEICEKAGVNRSTFYLHYETLDDLLTEVVEFINESFSGYFSDELVNNLNDISSVDKKELFLITLDYLLPYLKFVKDNKLIFQTAIKRFGLLRQDDFFVSILNRFIFPITERYHMPSERAKYVVNFYIEGMIAVIKRWIRNDFVESEDEIAEIIIGCVRTP